MVDDKIELRSEKVRHIIGEIPSRIVRYGITIITIVILGLLTGAYFIPYPETISAKVQMTNTHQGTLIIPYRYVNTIENGMTTNIEFDGYDAETYGVAGGTIVATSHTPPPFGRRQCVHGASKDNGLQVSTHRRNDRYSNHTCQQ